MLRHRLLYKSVCAIFCQHFHEQPLRCLGAFFFIMTGVSLYSAVDLIEILGLLLDVHSAQAFMTSVVISPGALLRSVIKLGTLGRLFLIIIIKISASVKAL